MRSSSDGALAKRAGVALEPHLLQLVGTKLMGAHGTTMGLEAPSLPNVGQVQQKQEQHKQWEYDDRTNSPAIAAATADAFALSSTLKAQSVSDTSTYESSDSHDGTATTGGYSIPAVSQMFIQAVQDSHAPRRRKDEVSARVEPQTPWDPSIQRPLASIQTLTRSVAVAKESQSTNVNLCEVPETAPKKNSTLEFGKKYSQLRVKVKRSFRKRGTGASRQLEEKPPRHEDPNSIEAQLRRLEAPRALATQPKGTEKKQPSPPQIHPLSLPSPPQLPGVDVASTTAPEIAPASAPQPAQPPFKGVKVDSPLARQRPMPTYEDSYINTFWCMWFVGFVFPPLWIGGSTGIFSSTRCGFMAGMANIMSLLVAIIVLVIFVI